MENLLDDVLIHIFQYFSLTERLKFESVCKRWQKLMSYSFTELNLSDWLSANVTTQKTSRFLSASVMRFGQKLEKLSFGVPNLLITSIMIESLVLYCPRLISLDLSFCKITESTAALLIGLSDRLENLNFNNTQFFLENTETHVDNMRILFSNLENLVSINLQRTRIDNLWAIPYLPSLLESINLNNCGPMRPQILREFLINTPRLKELFLSTYNQFDNSHLDIVCTYETLEVFELSHVSFAGLIFGGQPTSYNLSRLKSLVNLKELRVQFNDSFTQFDLNAICAQCKLLQVLDLRNCRKLSCFQALYRLKNLKSLKVAANENFTDKDLMELAKNSSLEYFSADRCDIGAPGITQLAYHCDQIMELTVNNCNPFEIPVISIIEAKCPKLQILSLQNSGLVDQMFKFAYTGSLKNLKFLDISYNKISDVGLTELIRNLFPEKKPRPRPFELFAHQTKISADLMLLANVAGIQLHQ